MNTVETTHTKITDKFDALISAINVLRDNEENIITYTTPKRARKNKNAKTNLATDALFGDILIMNSTSVDTSKYAATCAELEDLKSNYNLSIVCILNEYYSSAGRNNADIQKEHTNEYYRIITSENYTSLIDVYLSRIHKYLLTIQDVSRELRCRQLDPVIAEASKHLKLAQCITIETTVTKDNHDICECGARMTICAELSELNCEECGAIRTIIGAVFRDDQFYPQEGQKTKHSGYDTSRHYRFHIERLQALENKTFPPDVLANIEYIIKRDRYDRKKLNCRIMREILKDSIVDKTKLNYHAPLLVKMFGGPAPPSLNYDESRKICGLFTLSMNILESLYPGNNKPYYLFFIYKIIEQVFAKSSKIRILDYIYLQSRDTIVKNDLYFKEICETINDDKILRYIPTRVKI